MGKTKQTLVGVETPEDLSKIKAQKEARKAKKLEEKKSKKNSEIIQGEIKSDESEKKVAKHKKTPQIKKHGAKYKKAHAMLDRSKKYSVIEAVKLMKKMSYESFDASIELHVNTLDTSVKGQLTLPHGTGKEIRVILFSPEVEEKLKKNVIDFDILLAQPADMKAIVKYSKLLGPKGLMPTPKKGTLVDDLQEAKKKFIAGAIHYKTEPKFPIMHQLAGKISFTEKQLVENINAFLSAVQKKNIVSAYVKTTMTPAIQLIVVE